MAGETIQYMASFVVIVTVITLGITTTTQSLSTAFSYQLDQAASLKAKDTLLNIVENPGLPINWVETNDLPTTFGLQWLNSDSMVPSPFGLMRVKETGLLLSYIDTYNDLSENGLSLFLKKEICLDYLRLKELIDPSLIYGLQLSFTPVIKINSHYENSNLLIEVSGPSGPINEVNVVATCFWFDPLINSILNSTYKCVQTGIGEYTLPMSEASSPYMVYIRAEYGTLYGASFYIDPGINESGIEPIVTDYALGDVTLVHKSDLSSYDSTDIIYNSTFIIPIESGLVHQFLPINPDGLVKVGQPSLLNIGSFKSKPGFLMVFYKRVAQNDYGLVVMPWGLSSLGLSSRIGPDPNHVVNVVTQSQILNIGKNSYNAEVKIWRDLLDPPNGPGYVGVTISSSPAQGSSWLTLFQLLHLTPLCGLLVQVTPWKPIN